MSAENATSDTHRSNVLLDQTVAMLAPLIKLLVAQGVTYPQLVAALKPAFLRAARAELARSGKRINDSAISIVSGVHRKDVRALSSQTRTPRTSEPLRSLADEVAARWSSDPHYLGQDGLPLALPVRNGSASEPSFERLSQSVTRDFHSRAVLDELVRLGRVEVRDDLARLDRKSAIADRGFVLTMAYIARNVHDHLAAIEGNFSATQIAGGLPHLEHSVAAESLGPDSILALQELARRVLDSSTRRISALTAECVERESQQPGSQALRMRFGMYFYSEPESPLADSGQETTT
ncbi:MAG: DUF6502 family protein [Burkholderiaceae bacterium]